MGINQINKIPIPEVLSRYGYTPQKEYSTYYMYLSPFRQEKTASFQVGKQSNRWLDYGSGESGSCIDLVMRLESCTFPEALTLVRNQWTSTIPEPPPYNKEQKLEIIQTKEITHTQLIQYLHRRKIYIPLAKIYCGETHFKTTTGKSFFALSFPNQSGGYELRNQWFKGCTGKDITFINRGTPTCALFEGFFDFLSFLQLNGEIHPTTDVIILNTLSLLRKTIPQLRKYKSIECYLDNDKPGQEATAQLKLTGIPLTNRGQSLYRGYKDLNEYLIATHNK